MAPVVRTVSEESAEGVTIKFAQRVPRDAEWRGGRAKLRDDGALDGLDTETVIIPMLGRSGKRTTTLCVSSQIGCAMNCGFCETAQMGLIRNLTPGEIVGQWWAATHLLGARVDNIVFMGMGEPMDNFDAVEQAIRVLTEHNGASVAPSNITVSTVGRIDGLARFGELTREPGFHRLGLAISVNAPNDEVRDSLMPINRSMPMGALRDAIMRVPGVLGPEGPGSRLDPDGPRFRRRKVCFEYVLIPGVNDAPEHAAALASWLEPFSSGATGKSPAGLLNLIPYNPRRNSPWPAPTEDAVEAFMADLTARGVFVKRRRTKGRSEYAACGQLGSERIRKRELVQVTLGPNG